MLCWLASYPKSGNTWLRGLLENHRRDDHDGVHINDLADPNIAYSRRFIDDTLGVESAQLLDNTIDLLRPRINAVLAGSADVLHVRTHEMYRRNSSGEPVFAGAPETRAILLVRNPLDVVTSMTRFFDVDTDAAIDQLCDSSYCLYPQQNYVTDQLAQSVGSWSGHTRSWLDADLPVKLVHYEDLIRQPNETFADLIEFLDLPTSPLRRSRAIRNSQLSELRAQEARDGFRELNTGAASFFGNAEKGSADERSLGSLLVQVWILEVAPWVEAMVLGCLRWVRAMVERSSDDRHPEGPQGLHEERGARPSEGEHENHQFPSPHRQPGTARICPRRLRPMRRRTPSVEVSRSWWFLR